MAVASAVTAAEIAPESAFPEKLSERMFLLLLLYQLPMQFQGNALFYGKAGHNLMTVRRIAKLRR